MNFSKAIASGFMRSFDFRGRSSRSEYWYWTLFSTLLHLVIRYFEALQSVIIPLKHGQDLYVSGLVAGGIISLVMILPDLGMQARRLHDKNKSYYWTLIGITGVGLVVLLVWLCQRGTVGSNRYGADPLTIDEPLVA